ncbi:MAG: hypothetical protein IRY99_23000 [Isosphaeraceae bacterium]|nr:hypothetical protein [Isosphaeraceae bacterium]
MRAICRTVLSLGVVALMVSPALAQRPGGFGFGRGGMSAPMLLSNRGVQEELKLSEEQVNKAESLARDMQGRMRDLFQSGGDPEERREKAQKLNEEMRKSVADILKPEQKKRFDQIELQSRGYLAFLDPEVQKKLNLTEEQKDKLRDLARESGERMRDLFQAAGGDRQTAMQKIQTLRRETNEKAVALLTEDQKKTWKEMTGAPFEVRFERPRRID